jgi:hypothetical protein
MTNKVAFNPQDRFLIAIGNTLIVTTQNGDVFGLDLTGQRIGEAFKFSGSKAAFNHEQDRFVVTMGNKLIVLTQNGDVFGHDVSGRDIGAPFKFSGSKAAFNHEQDRFVVTMGNKLIVITRNGDVFGHDVSGRDIGAPFKFSGSKAAFNHEQDRFVVTMGNKLIVITQNGDVFGHDVSGRDVGAPFKFSGSKAAFNHEQDRFVVTIGNKLIVTTQNGDAFGHDVSGRDVGIPVPLNSDVATFDSGPVTSDLPLGGSVHLVMLRNGDFTLSTHAHDSGFDNIDYVISAVLVTASGIAFTFQHAGHVEGTIAGLPLGTPNRNDDFTTTGENAMITREFDGVSAGAKLLVSLDGKDKLAGGLQDLLSQAAEAIGKAAVAAAVALVV